MSQEQPHMLYIWDAERRINFVTFIKPTRKAIDDYFAMQAQHTAESIEDGIGFVLMDIRQSGIPPVVYMAQKTAAFREGRTIPKRSRSAIVYAQSLTLSVIELASRLIIRDRLRDGVRFFTEMEPAIEWLLAGDPTPPSDG